MPSTHDVIIVGAGPAGLSAGLYAARSHLDTLLLERGMPGGQLLNTLEIENYPGFGHIDGPELARRMAEQVRDVGCRVETGRAVRITRHPDADALHARWSVETESGDLYHAPAVVLAAGGAPNKLQVPGEEEYAGHGVSYCAVCDGAFFEAEVLAVAGGGDAACEEAHFLTRYARKVYLIHRRDTLRAQPTLQERVFQHPDIEVVWDTVVREVRGDGSGVNRLLLQGTRAEDGARDLEGVGPTRELEVGGLFIFIGFRPNVEVLSEHADHDDGGHLLTDVHRETSLPGLFAVGDVRRQPVRQITTAVGDGTIAALAAGSLISEATSGA